MSDYQTDLVDNLSQALAHLLAQRARQLAAPNQDSNWPLGDPVVGFAKAAVWYWQKQRQPELSSHSAAIACWTNAALYARRQQNITDLLNQPAAKQIPIVILKGMALVETLYPNPGLRRMGDIDLLVRHEQFPQVADCLLTLGWQPQQKDDSHLLPTILQGDVPAQDQIGEWSFVSEAGDILDLHWHLVPAIWLRPDFDFTMSEIWEESVPLDKAEWPGARTLSPEHTLAYLCLHLGQHGLQFLHSLLDIDLFVRIITTQPTWHWDSFAALTDRWRIRSLVYHGLYFSQALYGTPLPAGVLFRFDPGWVARKRISLLLEPADLLAAPRTAVGCRYPGLLKFLLMDRGRDLARVLYRILNPGTNWLEQRYGRRVPLSHHWWHVARVVLRGD
jgi:hypothetical protein